MDRWIGKVAVVTGASSGIGATMVVELANAGMIAIGLARRKERIEELIPNVVNENNGKLVALKCDVTKEDDVKNTFAWIESNYGGVDVLINNAGISALNKNLCDASNTDWIKEILDTNILGVILCTREAFRSMKKRNVDGHVILINSYTGHNIPIYPISLNIYPATKHALTALNEVYRQEFHLLKTKIKISSISPGIVETDIIMKYAARLPDAQMLNVKDISDAVLYVLGTPPHVQIHELMIMPIR